MSKAFPVQMAICRIRWLMEFEKRLNAGGILLNNPEFFFENLQNTLTSHFKQSPSIKLVKSNNFIKLIFTFLF